MRLVRMPRLAATVGLVVAMALVTGCSEGNAGGTSIEPPATTMPMMQPGMMGDANATPARDVADATLEVGTFVALDAAAERVSGEAVLARHSGGTTLTVSLEDLPPAADLVGHVHTGACADGGGPHYRHEPAGAEHPPNEIHIAFSSSDTGDAFMTVENATPANRDAASVVLHAVGGEKLVCADLAPMSP